MKAVISLAARMASTRLPGKVMSDIGGEPMLARLIRRLVQSAAEVWVATTTADEDRPIVELAEDMGVEVLRGDPDDLMTRHWQVSRRSDADIILLAGADDPLLDPILFDVVLAHLAVGHADYVRTEGWPLGMNVWGWTREAMERGYSYALVRDEREHVIPYWERRTGRYRRLVIKRNPNVYDVLRVTVDTQEDLELIRELEPHLAFRSSADQIIQFLEDNPGFVGINATEPRGTAARDALYDTTPVRDEMIPIKTLRGMIDLERKAAQANVAERGDFAVGQDMALMSLEQQITGWRGDA